MNPAAGLARKATAAAISAVVPYRPSAEGELPASIDIHALARFAQTVQSGMSILARDGATRAELEAAAQIAMLGWDARTRADLP